MPFTQPLTFHLFISPALFQRRALETHWKITGEKEREREEQEEEQGTGRSETAVARRLAPMLMSFGAPFLSLAPLLASATNEKEKKKHIEIMATTPGPFFSLFFPSFFTGPYDKYRRHKRRKETDNVCSSTSSSHKYI